MREIKFKNFREKEKWDVLPFLRLLTFYHLPQVLVQLLPHFTLVSILLKMHFSPLLFLSVSASFSLFWISSFSSVLKEFYSSFVFPLIMWSFHYQLIREFPGRPVDFISCLCPFFLFRIICDCIVRFIVIELLHHLHLPTVLYSVPVGTC